MTHRKEFDILEDDKKMTLYLKDGFTKKASALQEIRNRLRMSAFEKKVNVYLAPQSDDVQSALTDIRHQLISLECPDASLSSRNRVVFNQTHKKGERKIHAITYKLTTTNNICFVKLDSYKHPIAAYDDTAKEIALVLSQDTPHFLKVLFRPAANEKAEAFENRIAGFERFLKQQALEIPQLEKIHIFKKEGANTSLAVNIVKNESGQMFNLPIQKEFTSRNETRRPTPNTEIVSKYRLKQQRKAEENQNG